MYPVIAAPPSAGAPIDTSSCTWSSESLVSVTPADGVPGSAGVLTGPLGAETASVVPRTVTTS